MEELASPNDGKSSAKSGDASRQASVNRVGRRKFMHEALVDKGLTVAAQWAGDQRRVSLGYSSALQNA